MKINRDMMKGGAVALGVVALVAGTAGCSKFTEPFKDAPTSGHDNAPALVIEMPDGFSNMATKCINGIRYTVVYHGDSTYGAVSVTPGPNNGC